MKLIMTETKKSSKEIKIDVEEMAVAGVHLGHQKNQYNPKMEPYLCGTKNGVDIIDLEKTKEKLNKALDFIQKLILENKTLLIVGTKVQAKDLVKGLAEELNLHYINERWLGGTFSNFETIRKRINYFKGLEDKKKAGEFEKYTKKERSQIDRKIKDLEVKFGGIKNLEKMPDAIFVLDLKKDILAVKEAKIKGVKVIGICDSNIDPDLVDYCIPANDDAVPSIKYILDKVKEAITKVRA